MSSLSWQYYCPGATKKQTVQSLLPESALTPGKISSRGGRMFCVELLEVTHHSLELSGERAGTQPHTCFFFFLFFFKPKAREYCSK